MDYVCGLIFSPGRKSVLLAKGPKGVMNGLSGWIDDGDTPLQSLGSIATLITGLSGLYWAEVATITGRNFRCHYYVTETDDLWSARCDTGDELFVLPVNGLGNVMAPGLALIIALTLDDSGILKPVALESTGRFTDGSSPSL